MTSRIRRLRRVASLMRRVASLIMMAFGFFVTLVMVLPLAPWWARRLAGPWDDPRGDVLIVLGGAVQSGGFVGLNSYWRGVYAVNAFREGGFRKIVIAGGGPESPAISEVMRQFLTCYGIAPEVIEIEKQSSSTRENALFAKGLLDGLPGTKVLLTSDYHMFRAVRTFQKAGIKVLPRPIPDAVKQSQWLAMRWPAFLTLVRETVKIGYYWLRGWI